jgi:hypothetical protein
MAESTGLEPATSAVTGQRSNQLSYDSNPRKAKLEPIALAFNQKIIPWGEINIQRSAARKHAGPALLFLERRFENRW